MISGRSVIIIGALLLSGCVTTQEGNLANKDEAARLNLELGLGYLRQGDYEEARIKLDKSIKAKYENATAHRALGLVYERMSDNKGAEKQYRIAVSQAPDDADAINQLAAFLCGQGKQAEALKLFDEALTIPLYQTRYLLLTNAGTCAKSSDLPRAENYLRQALAQKPDYPAALLQMGEINYMKENYIQARAFVTRYLDAAPPDSLALWLGYRVEMAMKDFAAADEYATMLLKRFPESAEASLLQEQRRNAG
jgi:type IV pilus assembly protein PilF